jgi:hypothetical protein
MVLDNPLVGFAAKIKRKKSLNKFFNDFFRLQGEIIVGVYPGLIG